MDVPISWLLQTPAPRRMDDETAEIELVRCPLASEHTTPLTPAQLEQNLNKTRQISQRMTCASSP